MADNSVDLVCRACGGRMPLAKIYYPTAATCGGKYWHFVSKFEDKGKDLAEFLEEHTHCYDNEKLELTAADREDFEHRPFRLEYEHDILYQNGIEIVTDEEIVESAVQAWCMYRDKSIQNEDYGKKKYTDGFAEGAKWLARKLAVMPEEDALECVTELGKL